MCIFSKYKCTVLGNVPDEIKAKYDTVNDMINSTVVAKLDNKWGFFDKAGKVVYPFTIDLVTFDSHFEDDARSFLVDGKWIKARDLQWIIKNSQ